MAPANDGQLQQQILKNHPEPVPERAAAPLFAMPAALDYWTVAVTVDIPAVVAVSDISPDTTAAVNSLEIGSVISTAAARCCCSIRQPSD